MNKSDLPHEVRTFLRLRIVPEEEFEIDNTILEGNEEIKNLRRTAKGIFTQRVIPYYSIRGYKVNQSVFNFLLEPLKNARFHGRGKIDLTSFLAPEALVFSYSDEGDYFKKEENKRKWESRTKPGEKHQSKQREIGYGAGTTLIYQVSDLIYVDIRSGTLYTGLSLTNPTFALNL